MKSYKDQAIVLGRVDYGERDRILTLLCKEEGKISALAKGVRSEKSRLAGGIELLSESEVSFIDTRSDLKTLTGARLKKHYGKIVEDMARMQLAFGFLKTISKVADESAGQEFYPILQRSFSALNDAGMDQRIVGIWFNLQLLQVSGSIPDLHVEKSESATEFEFDYDAQKFVSRDSGVFTKNDLKLLRLCIAQSQPPKLNQQLGSEDRLFAFTASLLNTYMN